MQRRKINDRFEFPELIDMRPYTIQYLSDPDLTTAPDTFELVGVLVHSGSAESGHYYSFVKNHDADVRRGQHWIQFNDSDVMDFDYQTLGDCCFGGIGNLGEMSNHTALAPKQYSAYMLFYKRVGSAGTVSMSRSTIENIPEELRTEILQENEATIRRYCMFDEEFISFVLSVTQRAHDAHGAGDHRIAAKATQLMLHTICNITSRIKDCSLGDNLVEKLRHTISTCVTCSKTVLDWACEDEHNIRLMIIKCPLMKVRGIFTQIIYDSLQCLASNKECYLELYGVAEEPHDPQEYNEFFEATGYIQKLFDILARTVKFLHGTARPWDEFFGILLELVTCGPPGVALFLHHNLLHRCLELFYGDYPMRGNNSQYRSTERNRRPSYMNLLRILTHVMEYLDLAQIYEPEEDEWSRHPTINDRHMSFSVTIEEKKLMLLREKKDENIVYKLLYKQLEGNGIDIESTQRIVINWLRRYHGVEMRKRIRETLLAGISLDPASEVGPFLECLVAFVTFSEDPNEVCDIIDRVASEVGTIQCSGGREHLSFFRNLRLVHNDALPERVIIAKVVETAPQWAPALLTYCDPDIRAETYALIDECLLLERENANSEEESNKLERIADNLCSECFEFVEGKYLRSKELLQNPDVKALDQMIDVLNSCKNPNTNPDQARRIQGMLASKSCQAVMDLC